MIESRIEQLAAAFYESKRHPDGPRWGAVSDDVREGWLRYAERQWSVLGSLVKQWNEIVLEMERG